MSKNSAFAAQQSSLRARRRARIAAIYADLKARDGLRIERFPVTLILLAQLSLTIILPASLKGTAPFGLLLLICSVAVSGALYVELVTMRWRPRPRGETSLVSERAARIVLVIGALASAASALGGSGSYAVQIGAAQQSPLVALFSPFTSWLLFGAALYMWLYRESRVSRRVALVAVSIAGIVQLWIGIERAILGQSVALVVALIVMAIFARLIRFRTLVVMMLLLPIVWPPIYEYRNALRQELTGQSAHVGVENAFDRLEMDEQMAKVDRLSPKPQTLEVPTALTLIRTGLLPSVIDRDRPPINTGTQLNIALGGSSTSATSATMFGNVYIFGGIVGVGLMGAALAFGFRIAVRRSSPWALASVGLIYLYGMSFNATYPDIVPRLLQAAVSMVAAIVVVRAVSARERLRQPSV